METGDTIKLAIFMIMLMFSAMFSATEAVDPEGYVSRPGQERA
jgi:hypothetical protein